MADEYSSPLAREVARIIRVTDASSFSGSMGRFLLGLGLLIGAGVVLDIILLILFGMALGLTGWFWLYVLVLIPLIIVYERNYRKDYVPTDPTAADAATAGGEFRSSSFNPLTKIMDWGPRGLVDGFRGILGRRTVLQSAILDRAVLLVLDLNTATGGVEIKKLIHPPEDMQIFGQSVDMLDALDLIGRSTEGNSLWLISTFRQKLVNFSKSVPAA